VDDDLRRRLVLHLRSWLGAWPPAGPVQVVGSRRRVEPAWDGNVYPVAGVATPAGTVLSVPPDAADEVRRLGADLGRIAEALPALVDRPTSPLGTGVFRWCHEVVETEPVGVWLPPDDERLPDWLRPFNAEVLVHFDGEGRYAAGVGRKRHDEFGQELAVATDPGHRGRGLARRLVAEAARRVADEGAVATYLHHPANVASARVAEHAGFPDAGWQVIGLPVAS
jgi:GNAT superfamily N-acetyltransferase